MPPAQMRLTAVFLPPLCEAAPCAVPDPVSTEMFPFPKIPVCETTDSRQTLHPHILRLILPSVSYSLHGKNIVTKNRCLPYMADHGHAQTPLTDLPASDSHRKDNGGHFLNTIPSDPHKDDPAMVGKHLPENIFHFHRSQRKMS